MNSKEAQLLKYGGEEGYRAEMRRRRALVKRPGFASMDTEKVKQAQLNSVRVRKENAKKSRSKNENTAQEDSQEAP